MARHNRAFEEHGDFFRGYLYRAVDEVEIIGFEKFKEVEDGRVMLVSTHRSHMDYVAGGLELATYGLKDMRFAAGDNLTRIPWFGKKIREMGSFSVFRGKASQRSYLFKLCDQVKRLLVGGAKIVVYPEGGRSYSGRMMEIRTGITGAAVVAQQEDPSTPVYYLPATMAYDFIPEVPYFPLLLKGRAWRDGKNGPFKRFLGSLLYYGADIWAFFKVAFNRHPDKIRMIIGDPLRVDDLTNVKANYREGARNGFLANRVSIQECADKIYVLFKKMMPIMPQHLVAALLNEGNSATADALVALVEKLESLGGNVEYVKGMSGSELLDRGAKLLKRHGAVSIRRRGVKIKNSMTVAYFAGAVDDLLEMEE